MENIIFEKSFSFSKRIVRLNQYLKTQKNEYDMSRQLLRSGTSIGANVSEAQQAQSRPDFINKINIALKEAYETNYWLRLLHETQYLDTSAFHSIIKDCSELEKLLISIVKSSKIQ